MKPSGTVTKGTTRQVLSVLKYPSKFVFSLQFCGELGFVVRVVSCKGALSLLKNNESVLLGQHFRITCQILHNPTVVLVKNLLLN